VEESGDNKETIDAPEKIMMVGVEDKAPGEVGDC
jgi:hypothetical protein